MRFNFDMKDGLNTGDVSMLDVIFYSYLISGYFKRSVNIWGNFLKIPFSQPRFKICIVTGSLHFQYFILAYIGIGPLQPNICRIHF